MARLGTHCFFRASDFGIYDGLFLDNELCSFELFSFSELV